jgi:hypothetical protein
VFTGFVLPSRFVCERPALSISTSSIGTWEARHYRQRLRSGWSGDSTSSVIFLFIHQTGVLHVRGQSTNLMSFWSRSPDHVRGAMGSVPQTDHPAQPQIQASLNTCILFAQLVATTAVGRIGETEEVAHLVSYLASKEAGFTTGELREC